MSKDKEHKETFRDKAQRLAGILFTDGDLQGIVSVWPDMSDEAKTVCKKLAGMLDDTEKPR